MRVHMCLYVLVSAYMMYMNVDVCTYVCIMCDVHECLCVHVCVCVYVLCILMCVCAHVCGGDKVTSSVGFSCAPYYIWQQEELMQNLKLASLIL